MNSLERIQSQLDVILPKNRHWLFPRTGTLVVKCLEILEVSSFQFWRYGENATESVAMSFDVRVKPSTSEFLCREWRKEAFGFQFPELAFVPKNVEGDLFGVLSGCCGALWHAQAPCKKSHKALSRLLIRQQWAIFPLSVSPFLQEAATDYCLVLTNNEETHDLLGLELSEDAEIFQWHPKSFGWPIPIEAERRAQILWDRELSETD
ncbi:MAG: hypothetical protein WD045_04725 [Pirellulaceae bacterium]